jgi:transcriptional regulator with XRE-family HTH domain
MLRLVSALSGVSLSDITGPSRARAVCKVRSAAIYLLRTDVGLSAKHAAQIVGRERSTVLDLSRLVARGLCGGELVTRVREELNSESADRARAMPTWKAHSISLLAAYRVAAGLTLVELAMRANIARETLSRIEHGRPAHPETISRLAASLSLDSDMLIGGQEPSSLQPEQAARRLGAEEASAEPATARIVVQPSPDPPAGRSIFANVGLPERDGVTVSGWPLRPATGWGCIAQLGDPSAKRWPAARTTSDHPIRPRGARGPGSLLPGRTATL